MTTPEPNAPNTDAHAAAESQYDSASEEPEEQADGDRLQQSVAAMPQRRWNVVQIVGGVLLGCVCDALLLLLGAIESVGVYSTFAALLFALVVPGLIEKRVGRTVRHGQTAMLGTLAVWILGYGVLLLCAGTPFVN